MTVQSRLSVQGSEYPIIHDRFVRFVSVLSELYGCSLPIPDLSDLKSLSKFCSGLVEKDDHHPWRSCIRPLGAKSRFSLAHSLFLFRKTIPKEKPAVDLYVRNMCSPQEAPDPEFLAFAKLLTKKLFPRGWDSDYVRKGLRSYYSTASCSERSRAEGGGRGLVEASVQERAEFCDYVLCSSFPPKRPASIVNAIETGGKWRVISCPPAVDNALRAAHHSIYDHLSRFKWLLRGEAKLSRFKEFTRVDGEVFVSGDYESATDNLNSVLQKAIMTTIFDRAVNIPYGIRDHALDTYDSELRIGRKSDETFVQSRGQLMGQLTSFPLLCLVNYITFRYSFRGGPVPPVRINGDDIVFRATPLGASKWMDDVVKGGLTLSKGKTLVHSRGFTLNSTPFWASSNRVASAGFIRSSAIWKNAELTEQIGSLNSRFYSCCSGFGSERKRIVKKLFLSENSPAIYASRRSVTRCLRMKVDEGVLRDVRLWDRELFYLSLPEEKPIPPPRADRLDGWTQVPSWSLKKSEIRAWESLLQCAFIDQRWKPVNNYAGNDIEDIRHGCFPYGLPCGKKYRKMLGMSRAECYRWACSRRDPSVFGLQPFCRKGGTTWVLQDRLYTGNRIHFVPFVGWKPTMPIRKPRPVGFVETSLSYVMSVVRHMF